MNESYNYEFSNQVLSQHAAENLETIRLENSKLEQEIKEKEARLQENIRSFREQTLGKLSSDEIEGIIKKIVAMN